MDNSTKKLLEECSVGCKMGIESMDQVPHHVTDANIAAPIEKSCSNHKELEAENEVIQRMKAEYFALLKGEKIQWKDTVRHTEGTIRRNGFIFSFSIHGRNIREEIKLCVPNGKSDYATFTKLADNRLSLSTR